jgi:hypothetical protein
MSIGAIPMEEEEGSTSDVDAVDIAVIEELIYTNRLALINDTSLIGLVAWTSTLMHAETNAMRAAAELAEPAEPADEASGDRAMEVEEEEEEEGGATPSPPVTRAQKRRQDAEEAAARDAAASLADQAKRRRGHHLPAPFGDGDVRVATRRALKVSPRVLRETPQRTASRRRRASEGATPLSTTRPRLQEAVPMDQRASAAEAALAASAMAKLTMNARWSA